MASTYRAYLFTLAICATIVLVISGQTWVTVNLTEADLPNLQYNFSSRELEPIISALNVVPFAGVFGLMAARGIFQRLVGLAISLVGATMVYLAIALTRNYAAYTELLISNKVGRTGLQFELSANVVGQTLILPAVGITIIGILFTIRNFDSAKKRANYDAPTGVSTLTPWQALDSGIDPTISVSESGSAGGITPGTS